MALTKTFILATAAAAATAVSAQEVIPYVTLYEHAFFQGRSYSITPGYNSCKNVGSDFVPFNDIASSATWTNFPADSNAIVYFFRDADCQGGAKGWRVKGNNFPQNFEIDGINDVISSIMVRLG